MLVGNQLFKHIKTLNPETHEEELKIVPITTDDIPEGKENRYNLNYTDGKEIGDVVIRFAPLDIYSHARLDGRSLYRFEYPELGHQLHRKPYIQSAHRKLCFLL